MKVVCVTVEAILSQNTSVKFVVTQALGKMVLKVLHYPGCIKRAAYADLPLLPLFGLCIF